VTQSDEDLKRRIAELESQLEQEKDKKKKGVYLKVSAKGGVSLYGIRRFPITFYVEEWNRILDMADEVRAFIAEHDRELARRG
jgi:ABC-type Fe3+-hydroxamate transport system substrate-binding protein